MNRAIAAGTLAVVVIGATVAGWAGASRLKSPAQIAAETAPPLASSITYPVEKRVLSSNLIVRGTVRYSDPIVVALAPSLLKPTAMLVSVPPTKGTTLHEGDVALVVSGRPVFVLAGAAPGYRDLAPGTAGEDVRQIQSALKRLGFDPGPIDGNYDASTAGAVAAWYTKAGYAPFGPNDQQRTNLRLGQSAVNQATDRMLQARQAVIVARQGAKPVEIVDAKAAIAVASASLLTARAVEARDSARGLVDIAIKEAAVQASTAALDDVRRRAGFAASGVNPATGLAATTEQLAQLQQAINDATAAASSAEAELSASKAIAQNIRKAGDASVDEATAKLAAAGVQGSQLSAQQLQDLVSGVRTAQTALSAAEAAAAKDNSVAAVDTIAKQAAFNTAAAKAAGAAGNEELTAAAAQAQSDLSSSHAVAEAIRRAGAATVTDAQARLAAATSGQTAALQDVGPAVRAAQGAVTLAQTAAAKDAAVADADVVAKNNVFEAAKSRVTQAERRLAVARSGVDPVTGLPTVSPGEQAATATALKQAEIALDVTKTDLDATRRAVEFTTRANAQAISDALSHRRAAQAHLAALLSPPLPTTALAQAVKVAETELAHQQTELAKITKTVGVQVPANEVVFFPTLPLRIDDTRIKRGDPATADVMTVSGTHLAIDSALLTTEAPLTNVDAPVTVEAPDYGFTTQGHVSFIADKPGLRGTDAQHIAIELLPDDAPVQLVGASVRITIPTRTTKGEALVVPVSALSVRADGKTQLQVESRSGSRRTVTVTPSLSAQGFVAFVPVDGKVTPGDLVVIGSNGPSGSAPGVKGANDLKITVPRALSSLPKR